MLKGEYKFGLRFNDARISLECDCKEIYQPLVEHFKHHLTDSLSAQAEIKLQLKKVVNPIPTHSRLELRYFGLKVFGNSEHRYFTDFQSFLIMDSDGKKARGFIVPETLKEMAGIFFTNIFFLHLLFEMLRHLGIYFIHSAGLISPEGKCYLFPSNAGEGKSTITLYLIKEGYKYLSDDTVFLSRKENEILISGFERTSHIGEDLIERFEELKPFKKKPGLEVIGKRKKLVELEQVYPGRRLKEFKEPSAIIFPQRVERKESRLRPLDKNQALKLVLSQSPFVFLNSPVSRAHLEILGELVKKSKVWILESGSDWLSEPKILIRLLKEAVR